MYSLSIETVIRRSNSSSDYFYSVFWLIESRGVCGESLHNYGSYRELTWLKWQPNSMYVPQKQTLQKDFHEKPN